MSLVQPAGLLPEPARWPSQAAPDTGLLLCRAVLVQLGFFAHMKRVLGVSTVLLTRPLVFATSFMLLFSIVIALFKDIPDVKGDVQVQALGGLVHTAWLRLTAPGLQAGVRTPEREEGRVQRVLDLHLPAGARLCRRRGHGPALSGAPACLPACLPACFPAFCLLPAAAASAAGAHLRVPRLTPAPHMQIGWRRWVAAAAHAALGAVLVLRARQTDLQQPQELYSCYMFVWKLFYLEYLLLPILR